MQHTLRLVVGAATIFFAGAALAQPPGNELFPLKKGSKWTYKVGDQTVEVEVTGTEKFGTEEATRVVTKVGGKEVAAELYQVKPDGVYRVKVKDDKIDPPVKILALPAKKDTAWDVKSKVGTQNVDGKFKIKDDKEKVKVGDKEYEAVMVEGIDFDIAGTKTTVKQWFAKDKGIVKLVYVIQGTESVLELKDYTEGK